MVTVNIFSSVNKYTNVTGFQQLFPMAESCAAVRFTRLWEMSTFAHNISQRSVATHLRCGGGYLITVLSTSNSAGEKHWKIC